MTSKETFRRPNWQGNSLHVFVFAMNKQTEGSSCRGISFNPVEAKDEMYSSE